MLRTSTVTFRTDNALNVNVIATVVTAQPCFVLKMAALHCLRLPTPVFVLEARTIV